MPINFRYKPIIDTLPGGDHEWSTGTGSIGIFNVNGSASESQRLYDDDPWGNTSIVWQTNPDAIAGPDGGWNTDYLTLDKTKLEGTVKNYCDRSEILLELNELLVIEYYSRR